MRKIEYGMLKFSVVHDYENEKYIEVAIRDTVCFNFGDLENLRGIINNLEQIYKEVEENNYFDESN